MVTPSSATLRGAIRWVRHLPASGIARTRLLLASEPQYRDLTTTQYSAAYDWLVAESLATPDGVCKEGLSRSSLFEAAIREAYWLSDLDLLVASPQELPEDAVRAAEALDIDLGFAYRLAKARSGHIDLDERARIGSAGELAMVNLLSQKAENIVRHVALESDGFGYDIDIQTPSVCAHLEVKSTTRRGRITFYLSRHEYETMLVDAEWHLIFVQLDNDLVLRAVNSVPAEWIRKTVSLDVSHLGRWESMKLQVPPGIALPGLLPCLLPEFDHNSRCKG